jgi:glucose-6-phosphate isomerase, archaeal
MTLTSEHIHSLFDIESGRIGDRPLTERMLGDMAGYYADQAAFSDLLAQGNMLHYTVSAVEPAQGEGALHYAIARLLPGQVGQEYFMTKGHFHAWRPAAEYYIGLSGEGMMLMESEDGSESRLVPLTPDAAVYVPGHIAHRTINTGKEPLVYLGVYPAQAGHDYGAIAERNFLSVVVEIDGKPTLIDREVYKTMLGVEQDLRD